MHVHQFWWAWLLIFEDIATFKMDKFLLLTMDYSPWSSKNVIDRKWLKKFMQVRIDVKCMYTNFCGRGLLIFGDIATFKMAKFPILNMDHSPWSSKSLIDRKWLKKFMQVGIDVKCMHTNFDGRDLSSFGDIATFKNGQISPSDHGLYSMVIKKFNRLDSAQKIQASRD